MQHDPSDSPGGNATDSHAMAGAEIVDVLRIWVDEPRDFMTEVRKHIGSIAGAY